MSATSRSTPKNLLKTERISTNQIPSFYTHSDVSDEYSVIKRPEIKNEILYTVYDSTHHVRIMKGFQTPDYHCTDKNENLWLNDESQKNFFLRCYLPKYKISHKLKSQRIQHLIVMFNGLNECAKFDLYDVLGAQFAEYGIATILLPTPFHLNRRIDNKELSDPRSMDQANWQSYEMPTDLAFDDNGLYFYNFKRSIREFEELVRRIEKPISKDFGFFENYFVRRPEITLFGFSLGGLRALSCFLKHPEKYHSCITFNTGVDLRRTRTADLHLNPTVWEETFEKIERLVEDPDFSKHQKNDNDQEILDYFRWLYLGRHFNELTNKLEKHSYKYLSIQSGGDTLFADRNDQTDGIAKPGHGLNRLIVAGVGHVPTMDLRWDNWLSKVGENIVHFIKGCKEVHWAHAELERKLKELIKETAFFKSFEDLVGQNERKAFFKTFEFSFREFKKLKKEIKMMGKDPDHLVELYYLSKAFYPKFSELLEKISRSKTASPRR